MDLVITKVAFNHLPDFWKQVVLLRINKLLKIGGLLYIHDIVFQFEPKDYAGEIDSWGFLGLNRVAGEKFRSEMSKTISVMQYSTFGWILTRYCWREAGFAVEKCRSEDDFCNRNMPAAKSREMDQERCSINLVCCGRAGLRTYVWQSGFNFSLS